MATYDEVEPVLLDSIKDMAEKAAKASNSSTALKLAMAASALAETRAWLNSSQQPHGGLSYHGGSK